MTKKTTLITSLLILSLGAVGSFLLAAARPEPPQKTTTERGVVVETVAAERREHSLEVVASGVVTAAQIAQSAPAGYRKGSVAL